VDVGQQFIRQSPVLLIRPILKRQLDRLANPMSPAFRRIRKPLIHGRVVADQSARERVVVQNLVQGRAVFVNAVKQDGQLLSRRGPDAVETPRRLVRRSRHWKESRTIAGVCTALIR
jgi:hypothetical protein